MFTFLSTLPVWHGEYPGSFQKKLVSSSFKWPFWNGKNIDLSYELSLAYGDNVNKSVHHPIPTRENWEHAANFQSKSVSWRVQEGKPHCKITQKSTWLV